MTFYIRVWQPCNAEEIGKHLLIVGDLTADCANCRELGIDYSNAKQCPNCASPFLFIAARGSGGLNKSAVRRIKDRRPDLTFIDYGDYKDIIGRRQARDFFK